MQWSEHSGTGVEDEGGIEREKQFVVNRGKWH